MNMIQNNNQMPFDHLMALMTRPLFVMSYLGLIIACFLFVDQPVAFYFQSLDLGTEFPPVRWLTNAGLGGVYIVPFFVLALLFRYVFRKPIWEKRAWFLWLCVAIPSAICIVLKFTFGRSRPELLFSEGLYGFYGFKTKAPFWSFPSGHTTTIMGLAFGLCIIFPRYAYAFLLAAFSIAISRILLTNHFVSDVLMASYLSFIEVAILYSLLKRKEFFASLPILRSVA